MNDVQSRISAAVRRLLHQIRRSDIALGYAGIVLILFVGAHVFGQESFRHLVESSSTNLANLRTHPLYVLGASAFVVEDGMALLSLPLLVVSYAVAQHRLGRGPLLVAIVIGHLLATLFVAPLLAAGISQGWLPQAIATESDVGFSYGMACVFGLLSCTIRPGRRRQGYIAAILTWWGWPLLLAPLHLGHPTFTDVGHVIAVLTGLALAVLPGAATRR